MKFRVIDEGKYSEAMHQALEEVIAEKVSKGESPPTLRFWYRSKEAVPIGRFQAYEDEVQEDYIESEDIDVVRRITGGGAMYVEPGNVITYSLYLPRSEVSDDIEASYKELDEWAVKALRGIGLEVEHVPLNDIEHPTTGKIGGAAQTRKGRAVLHHATMSYDLDTRKMLKALRIGEEKVSDKAIKSAEKRVARMNDHIDLSREEVIGAMKKRFAEEHELREGSLTEEELSEAEELAKNKFSTEEWNRKL